MQARTHTRTYTRARACARAHTRPCLPGYSRVLSGTQCAGGAGGSERAHLARFPAVRSFSAVQPKVGSFLSVHGITAETSSGVTRIRVRSAYTSAALPSAPISAVRGPLHTRGCTRHGCCPPSDGAERCAPALCVAAVARLQRARPCVCVACRQCFAPACTLPPRAYACL
jgi:hypothetical protein